VALPFLIGANVRGGRFDPVREALRAGEERHHHPARSLPRLDIRTVSAVRAPGFCACAGSCSEPNRRPAVASRLARSVAAVMGVLPSSASRPFLAWLLELATVGETKDVGRGSLLTRPRSALCCWTASRHSCPLPALRPAADPQDRARNQQRERQTAAELHLAGRDENDLGHQAARPVSRVAVPMIRRLR